MSSAPGDSDGTHDLNSEMKQREATGSAEISKEGFAREQLIETMRALESERAPFIIHRHGKHGRRILAALRLAASSVSSPAPETEAANRAALELDIWNGLGRVSAEAIAAMIDKAIGWERMARLRRAGDGFAGRLCDQAGLIRQMDALANAGGPRQTSEATAKLLEEAAERILVEKQAKATAHENGRSEIMREVFALHEDTIERYGEIGQRDTEGKEGAYARGRCAEAKSTARAIGNVVQSLAVASGRHSEEGQGR